MLSRYYNSSLTILCDYSDFLPVYSLMEIFVAQLSFSRVNGGYLVPRLYYLELSIQRLMVRQRDKIELFSRLCILWYVRVVQTGFMLFI